MKPRSRIAKFSFLLLLLSVTTVRSAEQNQREFLLLINGQPFTLELALDPAQRSRGLMYRQLLDERHGMLLVYPRTGTHYIWMKNVRFPLSVIWLDDTARVIDKRLLPPCVAAPCATYGVGRDSRFVLELASSAFDLVQPGDRFASMLDYLPQAR